MSQQTLDDQLQELRLSAFRTALRKQQANPQYADLTFEDRLSLLVDAECSQRRENRVKRNIRVAGFPMQAALEAHTNPETSGDPDLIGKSLGMLNGSSCITLWANYFGRLYLPGVHLINLGNEAVQINFMQAYEAGEPTPPQSNIDAFTRYAIDLVEMGQVDAVLITCSTMNRAYPQVQTALIPYGVPVLPIHRPMMERAVNFEGRTLVVATHGPTIINTQALLRETAQELGKSIEFSGQEVEEAWHLLAQGNVAGHNKALGDAIREHIAEEPVSSVVLAQLSMTVFLLSYPDPLAEFGVPVITSGQSGFEDMRAILAQQPAPGHKK